MDFVKGANGDLANRCIILCRVYCEEHTTDKQVFDMFASSVMMESSLGFNIWGCQLKPYQYVYILFCSVNKPTCFFCRTGVCFCMLIWMVAAADNISDTVLGHAAHQMYFVILGVVFAISA